MFKQKVTEDFKKAIVAGMLGNPQFMQQAIGAIMGQPAQPQGQPDPNAQQPDPAQMQQAEQEAMMQQQQQGQPTPEQMQAMMQAGQGGMSGMGNMEGQPMTDSMVPPQEMMG